MAEPATAQRKSEVEIASSFGENRDWPPVAPKELGEMGLTQKAMAEERRLVRTLWAGTDAMRNMREEYLPQEPGESDPAYEHRLNRTFLFNGVKRTVQVLTGKPFTRPITLGTDIPDKMLPWLENIDNTGRHLNVFARDLFEDAILDGISYFLVDRAAAPRDAEGKVVRLNRAQEAARGDRPYWVQYCADDVLGIHYEIVSGRPKLTQVRLKVERPVQVDAYTQEMEISVLVLVPGGWALYAPIKDDEDDKFKLEESGETSLDYIPFVPIYTGRTAFFVARPPLDDLGWLNLAHWQSSSDQQHILHVARVPILVAKNVELAPGETIEIGPNRLINISGNDASLEYVEVDGSSIEAGDNDLQRREDQMGHMAMQMLVPRTGEMTATQTGVEAAESHSWLQSRAETMQDALELGLAMTAELDGIASGGGSLEVYKDFWVSGKDTEVGRMLSEAEQKGQISRSRFWKEWKRRDFVGQDFTEEGEQEALEEQAEDDLNKPAPPIFQPGPGFKGTLEDEPPASTEEATPGDE